jgi:hypothetical protein
MYNNVINHPKQEGNGMFIYLSLIVTLLALCGLVVSLATPASNRIANMVRLDLGKTLIYCLALTIIIALCTIPNIPPFSQGMHLGWGFLIGGILGILAIFEAVGDINGIGWVRRAVAMISIAVLGTAPIIFIFRGDPTDILIGVAIAAALVSIIGMISFRLAGKDNTANIAGVNWLTLFILAISIAAIGSRLAIIFPFKEQSTLAHAPYWLLPQIVLSVIILVFSLLVRTDINNFKLKHFLLVSITSVVLISLTLFVITKYLLPEVNFSPALIGGITFILIGLMLYIYKDAENIPMSLLIIAGFFIISISTISLRYMGGLGQMIAAATTLSVIALPALANRNNRMLSEISFSLVGLLLFMGLERYLYYQAHGKMLLDFQIQYNQIAIIIGMGVVWISTKIINGLLVDVNVKSWKVWVQVAILSLIMIVLPPITYSLWSLGGLWACLTGMLLAAIGWLFLTQMNTGELRDKFIAFSPLPLIILIVMSSIQIIPILMDERFIITRSSAHIGAMILFIPVVIVFMVEILRNKEQDNA